MTALENIKKAEAIFKVRTMVCDDLFEALGKSSAALDEMDQNCELYGLALTNHETIDKKHYAAVLLQRSAGESLQLLESL